MAQRTRRSELRKGSPQLRGGQLAAPLLLRAPQSGATGHHKQSLVRHNLRSRLALRRQCSSGLAVPWWKRDVHQLVTSQLRDARALADSRGRGRHGRESKRPR